MPPFFVLVKSADVSLGKTEVRALTRISTAAALQFHDETPNPHCFSRN